MRQLWNRPQWCDTNLRTFNTNYRVEPHTWTLEVTGFGRTWTGQITCKRRFNICLSIRTITLVHFCLNFFTNMYFIFLSQLIELHNRKANLKVFFMFKLPVSHMVQTNMKPVRPRTIVYYHLCRVSQVPTAFSGFIHSYLTVVETIDEISHCGNHVELLASLSSVSHSGSISKEYNCYLPRAWLGASVWPTLDLL